MKMTGMKLDMAANIGNATAAAKGNVGGSKASSGESFSNLMGQAQSMNMQITKAFKPSVQTSQNIAGAMVKAETSNSKASTSGSKVESAYRTGQREDRATVEEVYADELKGKLKEILGLSDEEFEDLLEKLGLTAMDLLQQDSMTSFVLASFGEDSSAAALVNEELANALLAASDALDGVVATIGDELLTGADEMQETDEFDELLEASLNAEESGAADQEANASHVKVEIHKESGEEGSASSDSNHRDMFQNENNGTFIDYLANKVDLTQVAPEGTTVYEAKEIVSQLVDQIKLNISMTKTSMEMVLNPEALGKVQVVVQKESGMLTARLTCENEVTKNALETSLQILKESFEAQGLKVDQVEVTIGNYSSEYAEQEGQAQEQGKGNSNKKINVDEYLAESIDEKVEAHAAPVASLHGTVEYMA